MTALREIAAELFEMGGAVVDAVEPDGLDVMAPEPLRAAFGWPELARLGFGSVAPTDAIRIGLDDVWLARLGELLGERGRVAERQLRMPERLAPPANPERLIDGAMSLPNAVWRLKDVELAWSRCLLLAFRYTAMSDEQREGLVWLGFNCTTGAALDGDLLATLQRKLDQTEDWIAPSAEASRAAGPLWNAATIAARTKPVLDRMVRADLGPFLAAMRRRLDRDRRRVHAYHDDLRRAVLVKLAGLERPAVARQKPRTSGRNATDDTGKGDKLEAGIARERMRIAAIEREYAAKLDDLRHNYALTVSVEWVQALVVVAPVYRHAVLVKRRKSERRIALDWHIASRRMELATSDWGVGLSSVRLACDEHLHLTEADGQGPCPACGKLFCRACHPTTCLRCSKPLPGAAPVLT